MAAVAKILVVVALALALTTAASAQTVPSPGDCASRFQSIGENAIVTRCVRCI
jgi:hypothetical protein